MEEFLSEYPGQYFWGAYWALHSPISWAEAGERPWAGHCLSSDFAWEDFCGATAKCPDAETWDGSLGWKGLACMMASS
jgi:hypothetical protein